MANCLAFKLWKPQAAFGYGLDLEISYKPFLYYFSLRFLRRVRRLPYFVYIIDFLESVCHCSHVAPTAVYHRESVPPPALHRWVSPRGVTPPALRLLRIGYPRWSGLCSGILQEPRSWQGICKVIWTNYRCWRS
ncbi:uncharacterized protein LOC133919759 [Phragmites australis]|uniref:uncharacterized protein LOC133919759 n=1 Tax=Phragmites australis TaxID=29695 RepID=UPI002D78C00F|nr:uncharacterized protein LOC133919759 [Phragmites australis]